MSWPVLYSVQPSHASCNYSNFTDCWNCYICKIVLTSSSFCQELFQHFIHFSHATVMCHICRIVPDKRPRALGCSAVRGSRIDPHLRLARASSRPARRWRRLYRARKWTDSLLSFRSVFCLHYAKFVLQAKNAANDDTVCVGCCGAWMPIAATCMSSPDLLSILLHKNLAWWAVTRETLKILKLNGACTCLGQYGITISPCLTG